MIHHVAALQDQNGRSVNFKGTRVMTGIYCIETDWWRNPRRPSSVEPILSILRTDRRIPYVHRDVSTDQELAFHLHEWSSKAYAAYPYLYLAVHGVRGKIVARQKKNVRYDTVELGLDWLAQVLESRCDGRVIMFASCSTMGEHGARLRKFLRRTHARAVLGYEESVDWIEATTFELALFSTLPMQRRPRINSVVSSIKKVRSLHGGMAKRLKFRGYRDLKPIADAT